MHACMDFCALSADDSDFKFVRKCMSTSARVSTCCTFVLSACLPGYEYLSVVSAHAWMHTFTGMEVWLCTWCVVRACKTDSVHKWTLDLLGTRWRPANLAYIVYWAFMQQLGQQNVFAHCSMQLLPTKMTSQKDNLFCVLWPTPSSRVTSSGSISCLFPGGELEP